MRAVRPPAAPDGEPPATAAAEPSDAPAPPAAPHHPVESVAPPKATPVEASTAKPSVAKKRAR
jgi:hypothetical protein